MALNALGLGFKVFAEDAASAVFDGIQKRLASLGEQGDKASGGFAKVRGEVAAVGASMTAAGAGAFLALQKATDASAEFEKGVKLVQTIADPKNFSFDSISAMATDMGRRFGGDLKEQTDAFYNALGSGAETAAEAQALLTSANKLAVGGNAKVDEAMAGLTSTISAYSMKMTDAAVVSDKLFAAVKVGAADMNVKVLAEQFNGVSAMAAALGVGLDESLALVARLTASGTSTSQSVTGVKALIEGILNPSKEATAEAKKLGIAFDQQALKAKGLVGILKEVNASSKKTDQTWTQLYHGKTEALGSVLKVFGDGGDSLDKMLGTITNSSGATDNAFKIMEDSAVQASRLFQTELQLTLISVGDELTRLSGTLKGFGREALSAFNNLPKPVRAFIVQAFTLSAAFLVVAGSVLTFAAGVSAALETLAVVAGPVAQVAAGFAALAVAAIAVGEGFRQAFQRDVGGIGTYLTDLYEKASLGYRALASLYTSGDLSEALGGELEKAGNEGVQTFVVDVYGAVTRIMEAWNQLKVGFSSGIDALGPSFDMLRQAFDTFLHLISSSPDTVNSASASWKSAGESGRSIGRLIADGVGIAVDVLTNLLRVVNGTIAAFDKWGPKGQDVSRVFTSLGATFQAVVAAFGQTGEAASSSGGGFYALGQIIGAVAGIVGVAFLGAMTILQIGLRVGAAAVAGVVSILGGLGSVVVGLWEIVSAVFTGGWSQAWLGAKRVAVGVMQVIIGVAGAVVSAIAGVVDALAGAMGKNTGFQKSFEQARGQALRRMEVNTGVTPDAATASPTGATAQLTSVGFAPPPGDAPATVSAEQTGASTGATAGLAEAIAAANANPKAPPPLQASFLGVFEVDGREMARVVKQYDNADGNRGFEGRGPAD